MSKILVGDKMPNLEFNTAYKNNVKLYDVLKNTGKTVFWVVRYIGCPPCRLDVHLISKEYKKFLELNTQVFVVMQSEQATIREDLKDVKLPLDIICDPEMKFYKELEILPAASMEELAPKNPDDIAKWEEKIKGIKEAGFVHGKYEGNEQQLPALFIVNGEGTIEYAHYGENIVDMPTVYETLKIINDL